MLEAVITSFFAFISTNIDDILILTFIFTAGSNIKTYRIILGKYLGMAVLTAFSILSAMGLRLLDERFLPYLGIVPIILAVKEIISNLRNKDEDIVKAEGGIFSTALLTIASGADNVGVYVPLFTGFNTAETLICIIIFAVMTLLWCLLAKSLASLPKIKELLGKYKSIIVPLVYIILGIYIFIK